MDSNRTIIEEELRQTTQCQNPQFIEVPVLFRNGKSLFPNQVNSFVDTQSIDQPSHLLAPRTFISFIDEYLEEEMAKYGITTSMIYDLDYHLNSGEVHCATNEARLCIPRR